MLMLTWYFDTRFAVLLSLSIFPVCVSARVLNIAQKELSVRIRDRRQKMNKITCALAFQQLIGDKIVNGFCFWFKHNHIFDADVDDGGGSIGSGNGRGSDSSVRIQCQQIGELKKEDEKTKEKEKKMNRTEHLGVSMPNLNYVETHINCEHREYFTNKSIKARRRSLPIDSWKQRHYT